MIRTPSRRIAARLLAVTTLSALAGLGLGGALLGEEVGASWVEESATRTPRVDRAPSRTLATLQPSPPAPRRAPAPEALAAALVSAKPSRQVSPRPVSAAPAPAQPTPVPPSASEGSPLLARPTAERFAEFSRDQDQVRERSDAMRRRLGIAEHDLAAQGLEDLLGVAAPLFVEAPSGAAAELERLLR